MLIDLQLHSTYSDGYLSPTKLVDFMAYKGIEVASLTDHNTISGLDEFSSRCKKKGIKFIPGLELYAKLNHKKFNILWYNFNSADPELHQMLRESQMRRRLKIRHIMEKLVRLKGFKLNIDRTIDKFNHYVPINHIVDEVSKNPVNKKIIAEEIGFPDYREHDVIHEIFKNKKYGVLNESYIDINRILKLKNKIGGQVIFNHPGKYGHIKDEFVGKLAKLGVDGIEMLSPHHSLGAALYIQFLARKHKLITTGGSDFHRPEGGKNALQNSWDYYKIDDKYLRCIKKVIG